MVFLEYLNIDCATEVSTYMNREHDASTVILTQERHRIQSKSKDLLYKTVVCDIVEIEMQF